MTFTIAGKRYRVWRSDPGGALAVFQIAKADGDVTYLPGEVYQVTVLPGRVECDCWDSVFRERTCKHVRWLCEAGLLPKAKVS